jgi:hypothetical protein
MLNIIYLNLNFQFHLYILIFFLYVIYFYLISIFFHHLGFALKVFAIYASVLSFFGLFCSILILLMDLSSYTDFIKFFYQIHDSQMLRAIIHLCSLIFISFVLHEYLHLYFITIIKNQINTSYQFYPLYNIFYLKNENYLNFYQS